MRHKLPNHIPLLLATMILLAGAPGRGQSAADFQTLEKQVQGLQSRVDQLQRRQADMLVNYGPAATGTGSVIEDENKLKLSAGVTELKLSGDLRVRYQYDQYKRLLDEPVTSTGAAQAGSAPNIDQRSRIRLRLRLNADFELGPNFFGGVTLATGQATDSNNQTITEGYDNYNIYLDKAFGGWRPNDWFTLVIGKQANPFYTTDLVWDPDITPAGFVETFDISKAFLPEKSPLSLQLISMQGVFFNNNAFAVGNDNKTDAWQFVEQLKARYQFNKNLSVTLAPGFLTYTGASLSGLQNTLAFSKPQDELPAPPGVQTQTQTTNSQTETIKYSSTGVPTVTITPVNTTTTVTTTDPATGNTRTVTTNTATSSQTIQLSGSTGIFAKQPKLANQTFVHTITSGGGTVTVTSPTGLTPSGETRDLTLITAPGDVSLKLWGVASKLYWDFAYNTQGAERAAHEYFLNSHATVDDFAWLVGFQVGDNEKAGDWSLFANYRRIGLDSIDPNLNDNEFALGFLNVQGVKIGAAYNLTDSCVAALTYYKSWVLRGGLIGGEATGGATLGNARNVDVVEFDLNLKF